MQPRKYRSIVVCVLCLTFNLANGKEEVAPRTSVLTLRNAQVKEAPKEVNPQEKVIRAAYEKLTMLNKAALLINGDATDTPNEDQILRFELSNFRLGPIQEILSALHREIKTNASGEVIELTRFVTQLNKGEENITYRAEWASGQYASGNDPHWTIGDLLGYEPGIYHDVGQYTLYDVTVSYQGRTRSYRALALFHNPNGSSENLKPSFWDSIVGSGGVLTEIWNERRLPIGEKALQSETGTDPSVPLATLSPAFPYEGEKLTSAVSESYSETSSLGNTVERTAEDTTGHNTGKHGEMVVFQGACLAQSGNTQLCKVDFVFRHTYENGTTSNWFFIHRNRVDEKHETATGPRGTAITCHLGRGVATKNCLNSDCTFTATLLGSGTNMQMSGGDVWNGQVVHKHTCNIPAADSGCTTPGFDGTCPPGTVPNGSGWCCPSSGGICGGGLAVPSSLANAPSPLLINPSCCSDFDRLQCFSGGGEWNDSNCSCLSPIVIDIAGNGFNLTNAANGVLFDISGTGVLQQVSWTAADSDDVWLALDRNYNGRIDSGSELFGSASPQPYLSEGESKNGFRALAMFDTAEYGGNGDGQIDPRDAVFSRLMLWQDRNHNGIAELDELQRLSDSDVRVIELRYRESKRQDEHGNWFRYRARVRDARGAQVGRWAWDVFLKTTKSGN